MVGYTLKPIQQPIQMLRVYDNAEVAVLTACTVNQPVSISQEFFEITRQLVLDYPRFREFSQKRAERSALRRLENGFSLRPSNSRMYVQAKCHVRGYRSLELLELPYGEAHALHESSEALAMLQLCCQSVAVHRELPPTQS